MARYARVLNNSLFYKKANDGQLLLPVTKAIHEVNIPVFVIGDSAYPMLPWLMKPYNQPSVDSAEKRRYNYRMSHGRIVVEIAFGCLKSQWRKLSKCNDMLVKNVPNVIAAACVLHNMCKIHGETFDESWANSVTDDLSQPDSLVHSSTHYGSTSVREALVQYFSDD